jgi:poly-D-alanine transfer protein DltD
VKTEEILKAISNVSNYLSWKDIENLANEKGWKIIQTKNGYKVYINSSVWCLHLERKQQIKHGIVRNLRKVLIKEQII